MFGLMGGLHVGQPPDPPRAPDYPIWTPPAPQHWAVAARQIGGSVRAYLADDGTPVPRTAEMIDFLDVHDYARLGCGRCPHLPPTGRSPGPPVMPGRQPRRFLHAGHPSPETLSVVAEEASSFERLPALQDELRCLLNRWDPIGVYDSMARNSLSHEEFSTSWSW
jgi:hypothetical protein